MPTENTQRRRFPRISLKPVKWIAVKGGGRTSVYRCPVMGLGGFFLACPEPLPVGSVLRFAFQVDTHIVRGLASVRNASSKGMGLGLLSMKMYDRRKMYGFLKHHTT